MNSGAYIASLVTLYTVTFLVTSPVTGYEDSCQCEWLPTQTHWCQSEFVVKATIVESDIIFFHRDGTPEIVTDEDTQDLNDKRLYIRFSVKDLKTYKGKQIISSVDQSYIYSYHSFHQMSRCGVILQQQTYLFMGSIQVIQGMDALFVTRCNYIYLWSRASPLVKKNILKSRYQKGCKCKISTCVYKQNCGMFPWPEDTCVWNRHENVYTALCQRDAICQDTSTSSVPSCEWKSQNINQCMQDFS